MHIRSNYLDDVTGKVEHNALNPDNVVGWAIVSRDQAGMRLPDAGRRILNGPTHASALTSLESLRRCSDELATLAPGATRTKSTSEARAAAEAGDVVFALYRFWVEDQHVWMPVEFRPGVEPRARLRKVALDTDVARGAGL